jgi:uncharacterized membrane protein YqiK
MSALKKLDKTSASLILIIPIVATVVIVIIIVVVMCLVYRKMRADQNKVM